MKYQMKTVVMPKHLMPTAKPKQIWAKTMSVYSALELEAATALLMLRHQYDLGRQLQQTCSSTELPKRQPTPPPPAALAQQQLDTVVADKCTPKEQVRSSSSSSMTHVQPLKKRSIPPHLLRRASLTPAKSRSSSTSSAGSSSISKAKQRLEPTIGQGNCTKALLKSCRNMIREFLDNQELV